MRSRLQAGAVRLAAGERVITVRYRQRETGMYEGAPYVDEWKPLPPRLHDQRTLERVVTLPGRLRVAESESHIDPRLRRRFDLCEHVIAIERHDGLTRTSLGSFASL